MYYKRVEDALPKDETSAHALSLKKVSFSIRSSCELLLSNVSCVVKDCGITAGSR